MPAIVIEDSGLNYTSPLSATLGPIGLTASSSLYNHISSSYNLPPLPTFSPPSVRDLLVASSNNQQQQLQNSQQSSHHQSHGNDDTTRNIFDDFEFDSNSFGYYGGGGAGAADDDLFGSPFAFDASENGLWNGRFVPPPPRPPFMDDILTDGVTTCDLCSWAMPTKSTFIFEGTIEKATELGWPLTLIIVSIISAILGAIVMVTIVRCKRKKSTNNRNETHVQWWSRNKRSNNHLRRSNIYTAHPADSIRGLHTSNTIETCNWPNVTTMVVNS